MTGGEPMDNTNKFSNNLTIGSIISDLRKKNNMTQKQLSEILHVSEASVSHYECGINSVDINTLRILVETFNISADYFIGVVKEPIDCSKWNDKFIKDMSIAELFSTLDSLTRQEKETIYNLVKIFQSYRK